MISLLLAWVFLKSLLIRRNYPVLKVKLMAAFRGITIIISGTNRLAPHIYQFLVDMVTALMITIAYATNQKVLHLNIFVSRGKALYN